MARSPRLATRLATVLFLLWAFDRPMRPLFFQGPLRSRLPDDSYGRNAQAEKPKWRCAIACSLAYAATHAGCSLIMILALPIAAIKAAGITLWLLWRNGGVSGHSQHGGVLLYSARGLAYRSASFTATCGRCCGEGELIRNSAGLIGEAPDRIVPPGFRWV